MTTLTITTDAESEMEAALERILELVRQGYTSGIEPCWEIVSK